MNNAKILNIKKIISDFNPLEFSGQVSQLIGITIECCGIYGIIGDLCRIFSADGKKFVDSEIVGFKNNKTYVMPFGSLSGIGPGCKVLSLQKKLKVCVGNNLLGRILNGLGKPIDDLGPVTDLIEYPVDNTPPDPLKRKRIETKLELGIRAIDGLLTCGIGQRMGIFAGSGVGKSTLMGMIARNATIDINVIVLVGERGREVREFIEKDLKEEGLKKSVVVVATSDQPAIIRQKSAMIGTAIAEYFRDQGKNVLFLMDSITRFAMAQREIGMASGEPPVSRGYTPSVFQELPKLLERTGNSSTGSITGLYTVLVEGDDHNEPISDTVRGILDGHIILSRKLAHKNHYPAIDVLSSVSRVMPDIVTQEHLDFSARIKRNLSIYNEASDLIQVGAYKKGTSPDIDESILLNTGINQFLLQKVDEVSRFEETIEKMNKAVQVNV